MQFDVAHVVSGMDGLSEVDDDCVQLIERIHWASFHLHFFGLQQRHQGRHIAAVIEEIADGSIYVVALSKHVSYVFD